MPGLTLILGPSQSGKSACLWDRIEQHQKRGEHAVLLVPEQATFRSERALCARLGGLLGVEVYSLERLSERLIERCGEALPTLSEQGRCMVLRRAAYRKRDELRLFSRASAVPGFAAAMDAHIGRFKQSCILPDALDRAAAALPPDALLARKLADFSLLYRESEAFLEKRYLTANDLLTVAEPLAADSWLRRCHIYVDEFDRPREQALRLLERLLTVAPSLTVALRDSDDPALSELFAPDRMIRDRLKDACSRYGIPYAERRLNPKTDGDPALSHLCRNLFSARPARYTGPTDAVSFLAAKDRQTEAALIADRIVELVRGGMRYSDFALLASDLGAYGPLLRRAFARRGIPLYYDATRPIAGLAATDFVRSAARCACLGFPISDLLRLLKSGYAGVDQSDVELLENYVLRYGLYGSELQKPFTLGEIPPEAERARAALMAPLLPLREAMTSKKTADKVRALWDYLRAVGLRETLEAEANALWQEGSEADAQLFSQLWGTIRALLEQLYTVLGDTEITQREFPMLLEEGLAGFSVGVLPGQGDCVTLGDLVRTRLAPTDTVFVLGCTSGAFPPARFDDDLINNAELDTLRALRLPVWGGTESETAADRLSLYSLLSKAKRRIVFSYPFSDGASELNRAPLLSVVESLFPGRAEQVGMGAEQPEPASDAVAFSMLAELISDYRQTGYLAPKLPVLFAYFQGRPDYARDVNALLSGEAAGVSPKPFGKEIARALYGQSPLMSASRLELYARCPFSQYLKYGLGAEERKLAEEKASDAGTFLHDALDAFVKAVEAGPYAWATITEEQLDAVLSEILPPLLAAHNDGIFARDPRLKESLFLRLRTVRLCALSIVRQLRAGRFEVAATELAFGRDEAFPPLWLTLSTGERVRVYGKIDRVDQTPDKRLLRVIDYKLGKTRRFDAGKLASGESLQLPLYFSAAKQLGGDVGGLYYMPLSLDAPEPGETPEHKLYGVTASDEEAIDAAETGLADKSALIFDLKRTKTGEISGAAASRERLNEIIRSAERIAARQAEGILSGEAELLPTPSACQWCPYAGVCRFDPETGCRTRYVRKIDLDDLLSGKEDVG